MSTRSSVVVAMSGGVDSSVAAALLVRAGYQVTGMMLRLWSEPGAEAMNRCCTPDAMYLARKVAGQLEIPFYAVDVKKPFREIVVNYFLDGYTRGVTPNPCLACNRQIRWGLLRDHAGAIDAEYFATGHYARLDHNENGIVSLRRAVDQHKDQSYILSGLNQEKLSNTLFPLGDYAKSEVRELAHGFGLPVAEKSDSQDLCFITSGDYRDFLVRNAGEALQPGEILSTRGEIIGAHQGLANYTIGQRKGLGLSSPVPLYVIEKNPAKNTLIVGQKAELGQTYLRAHEANWISGNAPTDPFEAKVQIRYRSRERSAIITPVDQDDFEVNFAEPAPDITPGQLAVIYQGEYCVGSGIIKSAGAPAPWEEK